MRRAWTTICLPGTRDAAQLLCIPSSFLLAVDVLPSSAYILTSSLSCNPQSTQTLKSLNCDLLPVRASLRLETTCGGAGYMLIFFVRDGQGYHNQCLYGTRVWDECVCSSVFLFLTSLRFHFLALFPLAFPLHRRTFLPFPLRFINLLFPPSFFPYRSATSADQARSCSTGTNLTAME
ncbi:hypothetical protein B0H12DRAFT_1161190 [Mycena haematopus]|nr:hypothetical protein B0H12DRAFT_1161190 [Mycena haematopus]